MAGVVNLSGAAYSFVPFNSHIPGAKACVVSVFDYDTSVSYILDLTSTVTQAQLKHGIQSIYMDGTQMSGGQFTVTVAGTNQVFSIEGGQSAYFPITVIGQNIFTITATSDGSSYLINPKISIIFYNVPFTTQVWDSNVQSNRDRPIGSGWGQLQLNSTSGTSVTAIIANFPTGYQGFISGYSLSIGAYRISIPRYVTGFFQSAQLTTFESSAWPLGPEQQFQPPMKTTGLNLAMNYPGGPVYLEVVFSITSVLAAGEFVNCNYNVWGQFT